jgi:hypothetical protein
MFDSNQGPDQHPFRGDVGARKGADRRRVRSWRLALAAIAALGIWPAGDAVAQFRSPRLLPDLVAVYEGGTVIVHQWTASNPCTPHSHTHTWYLRIKRLRAPTFPTPPTPVATLLRDGQPLATWTLTTPAGSGDVTLGTFTLTKPGPCPGGGTTVSSPPPKNYRLVIDPANWVTEATKVNNVVEFYVNPSAPFVRAP